MFTNKYPEGLLHLWRLDGNLLDAVGGGYGGGGGAARGGSHTGGKGGDGTVLIRGYKYE